MKIVRRKSPKDFGRKVKVRHDERGEAAVIIAVMAVMLLAAIPLATYAATTNQLPLTRGNQDLQSALGAAQSGVADYINRLNQTALNQAGNYWKYSATNLPPDGNQAFTSWVKVPGSSDEYFHYSVDTSTTASTGIVTLTSTGLQLHGSASQYRTLKVQLRTNGFLDYLLMTDTMMIDPTLAPNFTSFSSPSAAASDCAYKFSSPNDNASGATELDTDQYQQDRYTTGPEWNECYSLINFYVGGQTFNGPIMTNDMYYFSGDPIFNARVYSGSATQATNPNDSTHPYWIDPLNDYFGYSETTSPKFSHSGDPTYQAPLALPSTNAALKSAAQVGGCTYYGPTSITFSGTTMTVYSPETTSSSTNAGCVGTGALPLPPNGVIYVSQMPSTMSCASNTNITVGGNSYSCRSSEIAVQGTITGQVTVGSDDNVVISGNLEYTNCASSSSSDVLGLIAQNFVQVSSKFGSLNTTSDTCYGHAKNNPVIMAAILTLSHSFMVQNFWSTGGKLGTIYLVGSLAGKYADIEGEFSGSSIVEGYATTYTYDSRLAYLTPPFFLSPVNSAWTTTLSAEIPNPTSLPTIP
ncbi:MAG: hypothetical protein M0019_01720 [Actinomycetota bacterium]|nr:hypothetical protein [Actinomycetota bacterium]